MKDKEWEKVEKEVLQFLENNPCELKEQIKIYIYCLMDEAKFIREGKINGFRVELWGHPYIPKNTFMVLKALDPPPGERYGVFLPCFTTE